MNSNIASTGIVFHETIKKTYTSSVPLSYILAFADFCPTTISNSICIPTLSLSMRRPPKLITFDIDGTLLKSLGPKGNAAHHEAVNSAVHATFGIHVKVVDVPYAGSTDMAIMRRMCVFAGVPSSIIDKHLSSALDDAASRIHSLIDPKTDYSHLVLPGVVPVLDGLKSRGVALALATGNIEKIAWSKLSAAGIHHYFASGGFGNDAEERQHIVQKAIERSGGYKIEDVVHVGDALADVAVSRQIGVDSVGVLTGVFTREQLEAEQPLAVLNNLSDSETFFSILGFSKQ